MVARGLRLDHRSPAGRMQPGEQDRGFDLRRGDLLRVADRRQPGGAGDRERQPLAAAGEDLCDHPAQGLDHPPHRAAVERLVAGEERGEGMAGERPEEEPGRRAGVAEIERPIGFGEAARTTAMDAPAALILALELDPEGAECGCHGEHVGPLQQTADPTFASRERAEQQRAMRQRFVARDDRLALQASHRMGTQPHLSLVPWPNFKCRGCRAVAAVPDARRPTPSEFAFDSSG